LHGRETSEVCTARRPGLLLAALGALLLAACAGAPPPGPPAEDGPSPAAVAAMPPEAPAAEPRKRAPAAADLVGLSARRVFALFGAPTLLRREPPAEVWQYAGSRCVLFVFLYREIGDQGEGEERVLHAETGGRDGGRGIGDAACLEALRRPDKDAAAPSS
jgi:hypothetical protein